MEYKIIEIINTVLTNNNKNKISNFDGKLHLRDDLGFDSLELAELTVRLEEEFGVDVFKDGIVYTLEDIKNKLK